MFLSIIVSYHGEAALLWVGLNVPLLEVLPIREREEPSSRAMCTRWLVPNGTHLMVSQVLYYLTKSTLYAKTKQKNYQSFSYLFLSYTNNAVIEHHALMKIDLYLFSRSWEFTSS